MTNRKNLIDRRKQNRLKVKDNAFAVLKSDSPILAQIKEISTGGLTVQYFDNVWRSDEIFELDILLSDSKFRIRRIPCTTTANFEIFITIDENYITMRQQGLKFSELTHAHKSRLNYLIYNQTVDSYMIDRRINKDRRQLDTSQYSVSNKRTGIERRESLQWN